MGQIITTTDFQYKYDDEPHATRRKEILGLSSNFCVVVYFILASWNFDRLLHSHTFVKNDLTANLLNISSYKVK